MNIYDTHCNGMTYYGCISVRRKLQIILIATKKRYLMCTIDFPKLWWLYSTSKLCYNCLGQILNSLSKIENKNKKEKIFACVASKRDLADGNGKSVITYTN